MTNHTDGNSSWIDKTSKIHADKVWNIAQNILQDVANIDLFENPETVSIEDGVAGDYFITLPNGQRNYGKNPSNNYLEFLDIYLNIKISQKSA